MTRRDKRLEAMRRNPSAVRFESLAALLAEFGFAAHETSGSHVVFRHPELVRHVSVPRPMRGTVKPAYVREALALMAQLPRDDDE